MKVVVMKTVKKGGILDIFRLSSLIVTSICCLPKRSLAFRLEKKILFREISLFPHLTHSMADFGVMALPYL